jgi:hypothetical protein
MAVALAVCALVVPAVAGAKLTPGQWVKDGSANLDVAAHAAPCALDLQGDGTKDLLVGEYLGSAPNAIGKIRVYENWNTDENPRFDGWSYLQAAGIDVEVSGKTDT